MHLSIVKEQSIDKYLNKVVTVILILITVMILIVVSPIIILYSGVLSSYSNLESNTSIADAPPEKIGNTDHFRVPRSCEKYDIDQMRRISHKTLDRYLVEPDFKRMYIRCLAGEESFIDIYKNSGKLDKDCVLDLNYIYQVKEGDFNFRHAPDWFSSVKLAELSAFSYLDKDGNLYIYYEQYITAGFRPYKKWGK